MLSYQILEVKQRKQDINNLNYVGLCDKMKKTNKNNINKI